MNSSGKHQGDTDVSGQYANSGITCASMLQLHGNQARIHAVTLDAIMLLLIANQASTSVVQGTRALGHAYVLEGKCKRQSVHDGHICDCTGGSTESALRMSWVKRARRSQQWMTLMMTLMMTAERVTMAITLVCCMQT